MQPTFSYTPQRNGYGGVMLAHLATIPDEVERELRALVVRYTYMIHDDVKTRMGKDGNPSRPGGYPGIVSGRLRGSMAIEITDGGMTGIVWQGGAQAPYARYLRDGTKRMAARPSLEPSLLRVGEAFTQSVHSMINRVLA